MHLASRRCDPDAVLTRVGAVPVPMPGPDSRWRCRECGNLTRFDVTRVVRSSDYVHVDLSGEQAVEDRQVLEEVLEHVACRWCSAVDAVDVVARPGA